MIKKVFVSTEVRKKIREYYKTAKLFIPHHISWRFFTFRLPSGAYTRFYRIKNIEQLRKLAVKYTPINIWYSSSLWLSPRSVKSKNSPIECKSLIGHDVVIDIDNTNFKKTVEYAKKVLKGMHNPEYIIQTSKRGIQICFKKEIDTKGLNMEERLKAYENHRQELISKFKGVDSKITFDLYRVVRLPLSLHNKGNIVQFIKDINLIEPLEYVYKDKVILPKSRKAMTDGGKPFPPPQNNGRNLRNGIRNPANSYSAKYVTNNILGTKGLFVPILIYHVPRFSDEELIKPIVELKELCKKYKIPNFYLLRNDEYLYAISLIALDSKRLMKILKASTSNMSKNEFESYHQIYLRVSPYDFGKNTEQDQLRIVGTVSYKTNKKFNLSKSHKCLLESLGFVILDKGRYVGKEIMKGTLTWKN